MAVAELRQQNLVCLHARPRCCSICSISDEETGNVARTIWEYAGVILKQDCVLSSSCQLFPTLPSTADSVSSNATCPAIPDECAGFGVLVETATGTSSCLATSTSGSGPHRPPPGRASAPLPTFGWETSICSAAKGLDVRRQDIGRPGSITQLPICTQTHANCLENLPTCRQRGWSV